MDSDAISLQDLFRRALSTAVSALNLPTIQDDTQKLIQSAFSDLRLLTSRISDLSLFSPNETVSDISTRNLLYIIVPYALAEVGSRVRATEHDARIAVASHVQKHMRAFVESLERFEIVTEEDKSLYSRQASGISDPAKRREVKIKQYKQEKEIKLRVETARKRLNQSVTSEPSSNMELVLSLLPQPRTTETSDEADSDTEEIVREAILLLLRLLYAEAQSQLESTNQELQLLQSMPPPPPSSQSRSQAEDGRIAKRREADSMWKLDAPSPSGGPDGQGALLDSEGKPLRPFTILPSNAADRARLQAQVFQPDHRLPTMTIDEYLQIEQERGNIITGGGPQSETRLTTSEQLALDAEMDGTAFGAQREEERRQKDENWAQYTDTHRKGEGNTMNRG